MTIEEKVKIALEKGEDFELKKDNISLCVTLTPKYYSLTLFVSNFQNKYSQIYFIEDLRSELKFESDPYNIYLNNFQIELGDDLEFLQD